MSGAELVWYARRELQLAGFPRAVARAVEAAVAHLAGCGGGPAETARLAGLVSRLAARRPLSPLTRNPGEWLDVSGVVGVPMWQSLRDPAAFSADGGRSYVFEDDPRQQVHLAVLPEAWVAALSQRHGLDRRDAVAAVEAYFRAGPISDWDLEKLDRLSPAERRSYIVRRWPGPGMLVAAMLYDPPDDDDPDQQPDPDRVTGLAA